MTRPRASIDTVYRAMAYTTRDDWTPAKIRQARRRAELGILRDAADLVEYLQTDDRIMGALQTRLGGLLKLPVRIEDADGEQREDDMMLDALQADLWDAYPEDDLSELMAWGYLLGVGLGEHRWELDDDTQRLIPRLHVWHPRWLRYDLDADTWYLMTRNAGEIPVDLTDGKWILYTPYGGSAPWRKGLHRTLAHYWLLKRYALIDWGGYSEAHGNPTRIGTTPDGASKPDREELAADLQNIAGVSGIGLPPGFDVKLLEATADTYQTFVDQIDTADKAIAITILGQNLTTDVEGGSYAAASVHDGVRQDYIDRDEQALSTALHAGPLYWWALYNFGTEDTPWARWDTTPDRRRDIEKHHLQAGVVTVNELRDYLGYPPIEGPEGKRIAQISDAADRQPGEPPVATRRVALASGADPREARGAIRGQLYLDRIAARGTPLAALQANARALIDELQAASDYDDLFQRLLRLYEGMDPDEVAGLMESLMMADLAGRQAVLEDA